MLLSGYSDFEAVNDLETGKLALLPLEEIGDAEGFRYRKDLHIHVQLSTFGNNLQQTLTGKWQIRLRESAAPDAPILFEQTVEWRAQIIALIDPFFGSIALVTWNPLDNGDGRFTTTIVDGGTVEPSEAWKYVDFLNPTENSEIGITDFEPTGVATVGTFEFFATFYSPPYLSFVPEGAVLDRVFDNWGMGFLDQNATFQFSFKEGKALLDAAPEKFGGFYQARTQGAVAVAALGYEPFAYLGARGVVEGVRDACINQDRNGRVWLFGRNGDGWFEWFSLNGGHTFQEHKDFEGKRIGPILGKDVRMARALILDDNSHVFASLDGYDVLWKRVKADEESLLRVGTVTKKGPLTPAVKNGKLFILGEEGVLFVSTNNGKTWKARGKTAQEIANENKTDGAVN